AEVFEKEVLAPASAAPGGLKRVLALSEAFLGHLERRGFPGGCFFAAVAAPLASCPGRGRARVLGGGQRWLRQFTEALGQARDSGELSREADIDQLVFEITAMMVRANFAWIVTGDKHLFDQARIGIRHVLERVVGPTGGKSQSSERRATR